MHDRALGIVLAALMLACPGVARAQDPAIYDRFFRLLDQLQHQSNDSVSVRDFIGLTDSEVKSLNGAAADYVAKIGPLTKRTQAEVFESRLKDIESGRVFDKDSDAMSEPDQKQAELIRDQLTRLKSALSESHFTLLDNYVRSAKALIDLLPAVRQSSAVPVRKKP